MGFLDTSMWAKLSAICLMLAFVLFIIAFAAPNWASTNSNLATRNEHIGLWRYCADVLGGGQVCDDFIDYRSGDWIKAAQAFMTIGLFGMMGSLGAVCVAAFVPDFEGEPKAIIGAIVVTAITTFFLVIGVGVFGGRYQEYFETKESSYGAYGQLSWAFGVAATSLIMTFTSCVLLVFELVLGRQSIN